jgi:cation:H+ antiporter
VVIGLTIVALGTSTPEFAVTLDAALAGKGDIAVGNVVGSNIFNVGFILGGVALLGGLTATRRIAKRDGLMLLATAVVLLVFLWDGVLARVEGAVLLSSLIAYVAYLFRRGSVPTVGKPESGTSPVRDVVRFVGGLGLIIGSAHLLVIAATDLALVAGISEWVIGVTVVAIGTSTPELVTALVATRRGQSGLSAGSLIGSDLFNILGVLGLGALLRPLTVDPTATRSLLWLVGTVLLVVVFLWTGRRLGREEGGVLVGVSMVRWIVNLV